MVGRERVAGVYDAATGRREIAGQLLHAAAAVLLVALLTDASALLTPALWWSELINAQRLFGARVEVFGNGRHGQRRRAHQVPHGNYCVMQMKRIAGGEAVAPIVEREPE